MWYNWVILIEKNSTDADRRIELTNNNQLTDNNKYERFGYGYIEIF